MLSKPRQSSAADRDDPSTESTPYFDKNVSIGEASARDRFGEYVIAGANDACGVDAVDVVAVADVVDDPFSHLSASSLKLFDPLTDEGEAELSFLGGAKGKSFGRSVFSDGSDPGVVSSPGLNLDAALTLVSLLMDDVEEPVKVNLILKCAPRPDQQNLC